MRILITEPTHTEVVCGCDLYFDSYESNTTSVLTVGNLMSDDCEIEEYVIDWYRDSISNGVELSTGIGSDPSIIAKHPLIGSSSVPVIGGTWIPIIRYIVINGERIYATKRPGYKYCDLSSNILPQIIVASINCSSTGGSPLSDYPFGLTYVASEDSNQSERIVRFDLPSDGLTKYIAVYAQFEEVADKIDIYFKEETTPLETYIIGSNLSLNYYASKPYEIDASFSKLIVNLTNKSYFSGDYLKIKITPSVKDPGNINTNWKFYLKCLPAESFENIFDKIGSYYREFDLTQDNIQSSWNSEDCYYDITFSLTNPLTISGSSNFSKYLLSSNITSQGSSLSNGKDVSLKLYHDSSCGTTTTVSTAGTSYTNMNNTVTYNKTGNNLLISFNNSTDYNAYKTAYNTTINHQRVINYNSDPTNVLYYTWFYLNWRETLISCGDLHIARNLRFHITSPVTFDDNNLTIQITMLNISNGYVADLCGDCYTSIDSAVTSYFIDSNNLISTTICRNNNPFGLVYITKSERQEWDKEFYYTHTLQIPPQQNVYSLFNGWYPDTRFGTNLYRYYRYYLQVVFTSTNTSVPVSDPDHPTKNFKILNCINMITGQYLSPGNRPIIFEVSQGQTIIP